MCCPGCRPGNSHFDGVVAAIGAWAGVAMSDLVSSAILGGRRTGVVPKLIVVPLLAPGDEGADVVRGRRVFCQVGMAQAAGPERRLEARCVARLGETFVDVANPDPSFSFRYPQSFSGGRTEEWAHIIGVET
jgi:hypothetical protein